MITAHQPTIFPHSVTVRVSSVSDGNINYRRSIDNLEQTRANRQAFIQSCGGRHEQASLVYVEYTDATDFCRYAETPGVNDIITATVPTDALVTRTLDYGLFLPLADCCGVVLYDPVHHALMLSHIGRHSAAQYGALRSVEYMTHQYGSVPAQLLVWLSPAAGGRNYPVFARDNQSLHDLIQADLVAGGVYQANIEVAAVDTTISPDYFSHSQWQKGQQAEYGRFAVLAFLR